jgi:hypothetical protein
VRPSRHHLRRERPSALPLPPLSDSAGNPVDLAQPGPGLTPAVLQRIAGTRSDTEAAQRMQQAKRRLFAPLRPPAGGPWK